MKQKSSSTPVYLSRSTASGNATKLKTPIRTITCRLQLYPIQPWKRAAFNFENIAIFECTRLARPAHINGVISRLLLSTTTEQETTLYYMCIRQGKTCKACFRIKAMIDKCIMSYVQKVKGVLIYLNTYLKEGHIVVGI